MDLLVEQYGSFISKHQGRLRVMHEKQVLAEVAVMHLEQVVILSGGVGISSDAIRACVEQGIPIHFLSSSGTAYAGLYAAGLVGTVQTRRAQLAAETDTRSLLLVKAFAGGKLRNQANLLRYLVKNHRAEEPDLASEIDMLLGEIRDEIITLDALEGACAGDIRPRVLAAEGRAASSYWDGVRLLLRADLDWPGRRTQGARDPLNSALN